MPNRSTVNTIVGLLVVVSAGLGVFLIVRAIVAGFSSLQVGVSSAIVASAGAVLLAITNVVVQRVVEKRREIEARQRDKKVELYQQFTKFWFDMVLSTKNRKTGAEGTMEFESLLPEMNELTQQMILWASDGVLKSYSEFRRYVTTPDAHTDPMRTMLLLERLLLEFRKDLGYSNRGLKERDVLALFVNDVDRM